jgi:predicted glycosyltransferase
MRILVDISHPAHVHFFKHAIRRLRTEGHEVLISSRSKDVTTTLLDLYGFTHHELSAIGSGWVGMGREFIQRELALGKLIRKCKPDVITAAAGAFIVPAGRLSRVPTVVFTDTEHASIDRYLTYAWATRICTPYVFKRDLGAAHYRYDGFHEWAYLHPDYFQPDTSVLADLGVDEGERFTLIRFVSWQASHDVGEQGLSDDLKERAVSRLSRYGRVFITDEKTLPTKFKDYALGVPPHRIHDVLLLASLYLGEGATMATEAGLLGTPSVYVSSLVGTMGNFQALAAEGLVLSFRDGNEALDRAEALLADENTRSIWRGRSQAFCNRLVDVTDFLCQQLLEAGKSGRSS